jgi:GT2 family glycosyltransferase
LETACAHCSAAITVPAISTAPNPVTVRSGPGDAIETLPPFCAPPAGVCYLVRADLVRALGAWDESYEIASGEDVDLCFKVWVNDLDVVYDQRVFVEHVGHATASQLDDSRQLWERNRRRFLEKWKGPDDPPRLATCPPDRFARNRATARAVAQWMDQYFTLRDKRADPRTPTTAARLKRRVRRLFPAR